MKKTLCKTFLIFLVFILAVSFVGCGSGGSGASETANGSAETTEPEEAAAGYEFFGSNLWGVGGFADQYGKVIDIKDNKELTSMYDGHSLIFDSQGKYLYLNVFPTEGTYEPYEGDGAYEYYLLKPEKSYKWDAENDEFVENELGSKSTYIINIVDNNTIEYVKFDAITGKAKANESTLLFVRSDAESPYIQDNKINIQTPPKSSSSDGSSGGNSSGTVPRDASYEAIYDEYVAKMEDALPGLISEYESEAYGVTDIETLAEINNEKLEKLAEISTEGMEKMAELMYKKGDSNSKYEAWAMKLSDKYMELGEQITDAYLESAENIW